MARINQKDKELLAVGLTIDLDSPNFNYIGGPFLSNQNDYIEALIHDSNANFLESAIVNPDDYLLKNNGNISLKQGNILRRLGYDRGKFIVKYNFLRKYAGSYENVLVNNQGQILNRPYDPTIDTEDMIKEYKYFVHEISPSRREIRLLPQSISDPKYIEDFYLMQREYRKTPINARIKFNQIGDDPLDTNDFQLEALPGTPINPVIEDNLAGGALVSDQALITSYTLPEPVFTGDAPTRDFEIETDDLQPSFFIELLDGEEVNYGLTGPFTFLNTITPDLRLVEHYNIFKGFDEGGTNGSALMGEINPEEIGAGLAFNNNPGDLDPLMKNIATLPQIRFRYPIVKTYGSKGDPSRTATLILTSNSALPNVPTTYTWAVTGWDWDTGGGGTTKGWHRFRAFDPDQLGNDEQYVGEVGITTPNSTTVNYATVTNPAKPLEATFEYDGLPDTPTGCSLEINLYGGDIAVGVMLTLTQSTGLTKTIHYPCIVRTDWTND